MKALRQLPVRTGFKIFLLLLISMNGWSQILPGASRTEQYLPLLKNKRVCLFANPTSMVNDTHLVDVLVEKGVTVSKIFGPEHGFRGDADDGVAVANFTDKRTGIPVISLYGDHKKPTAAELADVDVMIFDIQDVGVRFYTYISSLEYYLEAAIENNKPVVILDRPNPLGFYVDGPVLELKYRSFIGRQPVPIVYGLTVGEYATMLLGEKWVKTKKPFSLNVIGSTLVKPSSIPMKAKKFSLTIVANKNYDHSSKYVLPVKPSPNLPSIESIYWYPSICFFEATVLSEGRGTTKPFQVFGHPSYPSNMDTFTPVSMQGAVNPKHKNKLCYGWDLSDNAEAILKKTGAKIQLKYLLEAYKLFPEKNKFFLNDSALFKHAGNSTLRKQVIAQVSEDAIRKSWEPALSNYKKMRKKYLLYKDF